jgi:dTDP-4-amino-4,6-dideoxygalactose transaminase
MMEGRTPPMTPIPHSRPTIQPADIAAVRRVLRTGAIGAGPEVERLEHDLARGLGAGFHATATQSGTAALHLALLALRLPRRSRVAIPAYACAALAHAVHYVGARPVLLDVDPATLAIDPARCRPRLRRARAAIVPHPFGYRAPIERIAGIPVIEDCATALGPGYGATGLIGVTSFYATKLLAAGQGGAVWTRDPAIARRIRDLVHYDGRENYRVRYNYRLSALAAALARAQLARLADFLRRRRRLADVYFEALDGIPARLPPRSRHLYYRFVLGVPRRAKALMEALKRSGIEAKRPVWRPLHHWLGGRCPGADQAHRETVSLPIYPSLAVADARYVAREVRRFFG